MFKETMSFSDIRSLLRFKGRHRVFPLFLVIALASSWPLPGRANSLIRQQLSEADSREDALLSEEPSHNLSSCTPPSTERHTAVIFGHILLGKKVTLLVEEAILDLPNIGSIDEIVPEIRLPERTLNDIDETFKADIEALIDPYIGKEVTLADLQAIQDEISLLYLQRGYLTSWADCVDLLSNGTLIIHVTEGFIQNVDIGWVNDVGGVYVPAEDGPRDWQYAADYLAPVLKDEDGLPKRPVNLIELESRLQALAEAPRYASLHSFSRLQIPPTSLLETSIELSNSIEVLEGYLKEISENPSAQLTTDQVQSLIDELEAQKANLDVNIDTTKLGASVLEINLENIVAEVSDLEDETFTDNRASRAVTLDNRRSQAFRRYFGRDFQRNLVDASLIRFALHSLELQRPNIQAAVVYIAADGNEVSIRAETAYAPPVEIQNIARFERKNSEQEFEFNEDTGQFERDLHEEENTSGNQLLNLFRDQTVGRDTLVVESESFWRAVQNPDSDGYRLYADRLYDLLIRPVENEFKEQGIEVNTLLIAMDADLGLLPLASLYDSETEQYLAEKYRLAIIPNFQSLDIRPSNLAQADILAMGSSEFRDTDRYAPLTAVPIELALIDNIWNRGSDQSAKVLRNESFTLEKLRQERRDRPYQIVHLASHANFRSGQPGDSSIQFWDTTLPLNELQLATLNFNAPPLELLVLSACQTALGDEDAVLGFAGSFLNAEVKSVLASLWYVNDLASLIYMTEFYRNLRAGITKAEAVQNTQLAMLDEQRLVQNLKELNLLISALLNDDLYLGTLTEAESQRLHHLSNQLSSDRQIAELAATFTHPFYWSAYTLVGNPW